MASSFKHAPTAVIWLVNLSTHGHYSYLLYLVCFFVYYHLSIALPLDEFEKNPLTVMVVTTHGGHFGFLTGLLPRYDTWMNTVCRQFLSAIKTYSHHQEDSHTPS